MRPEPPPPPFPVIARREGIRGKLRLFKLMTLLKPHLRYFIVAFVLSLISTAIGLLPPYISKEITDKVLVPRKNFELLISLVSMLVVLHLVNVAISATRDYIMSILNNRVILDLRERLYRHILALGLDFYDRVRTGDIVARVFSYVRRIHGFLIHGLQSLIINSLILSGTIVIIFTLNLKLALISLVPIPVIILGTRAYQKRARFAFLRLWKVVSSFTSYVTSVISSVVLVKVLGREELEIQRFRKYAKSIYDAEINLTKLNIKYFPFMSLSLSLASTLVMFFGGLMVLQGETTIGTLMAFLGYLWHVYNPIRSLNNLIYMYTQAETAYEKLLEVLSLKPSVKEDPEAIDIELKGSIRVDKVYFSYAEEPVLKGISFEVLPGEVIGIVGPNGSGKTTLMKLLTRLYDPKRGKILLDGINLKKIKLDSLRRQLVMLTQEPLLLPGSIAFNIAYGSSRVSPEDVLLASKISCAHDFIMNLPLAYDTDVGEAGRRLSGGQKQMVCIARALVRRPNILILDEAMSSIAVDLESKIIKRVLSFLPNSTIIIVSHRPGLINYVNRIIKIENGMVVGEFKGFLEERPKEESRLNFIDPSELTIRYDGRSLRIITKEGLTLTGIKAKLPFPLSCPRMVILYGSDGEELCIIRNYEELDKESKEAILNYLRDEYHIVNVRRLIRMEPLLRRTALVILEDEERVVRREIVPLNAIVVQGCQLIIVVSKRIYVANVNSLSKDARLSVLSFALEAENLWT